MNGAGSNPDAHVVAYAGAQEKKGLEIAKKLNAENYGKKNQVDSILNDLQKLYLVCVHVWYKGIEQ